MAEPLCFRFSSGLRDEFCKFAEIVGGCREEEFVFGSIWSSEAQSVELHDMFEVSQQHFVLLSSSLRIDIGVGCGNLTSNITSAFIDMTAILRTGWLGQQYFFSRHSRQSYLLAQQRIMLPESTGDFRFRTIEWSLHGEGRGNADRQCQVSNAHA